jgi:hypothetical protein
VAYDEWKVEPLTPLNERVLRLAESLNTHMPLGAGETRIERTEWVIWLGSGSTHPEFTVVQRLRLAEGDIEAQLADIRAVLTFHRRPRAIWEIGPSATPRDLADRLLALGLTRYQEPTAAGMVLRRPLPLTETRALVRRAISVEDHFQAFTVLNEVFGERVETIDERRRRAERTVARGPTSRAIYLATLEGKVVGAASAIFTDDAVVLSGSATLPEARGLGTYRALIRARHEDAVARGTPQLVIQAGAMSRPILERLGFETVAIVELLLDTLPEIGGGSVVP